MGNDSYNYKMQSEGDEFEDEFLNEEAAEEEEYEEHSVSFACEDCDYRWEMTFEQEEQSEEVQYCPMCGSANTTQI